MSRADAEQIAPSFPPPAVAWSRDMDIQKELLNDEEIASITGYKRTRKQIEWLADHGWQYTLTGARRPVVGRVYARLKLAGVKPSSMNAVAETWALDLSRVG